MPTDPAENINNKIPEIPHDGNQKWSAALMFPVVDASGTIIGYAPPAVIVKPDGSAILESTLSLTGDIDIGNVNLLDTTGTQIDPATEQKQDDIITAINNIDFGTSGLATEVTLDLVRAAIQSIDIDFDVALSTLSTSVNQGLILTELQNLVTATTAPVLPTGAATEDKQDDGIVLLTSISNKDFATQTTLNSLLTAFNNEDFATEATLTTRAAETTVQEISDRIGALTSPAVGTTHELLERLDILLQSLETILSTTGAVVQIQDGTGGAFKAAVDSSNRLVVSAVTTAPPATTAKDITAISVTNTVVNTFYTIPNGAILTIQQLRGGADWVNGGSSKVELFEDPNGTGVGMLLQDVLYMNGSSNSNDLNLKFVGNGIRRILLRRTAIVGPAREIFGAWKGFEA